jgi:cell wall-associated NlpC family hydrolase
VTTTLLVLAAFVATSVFGVTAAGADPSIESKRAQAEAILAEVRELDSRVGKAAEAYNLATIQLGEIDADLASNGRHLKAARKSLGVAQANAAQRLRALYINGDGAGAIEVILGARSLDDLISRLDVAQRVGEQDAKVLRDVRQYRRQVQLHRERLTDARARQARVVAERAAQRRAIESELVERERMLASVKDEIARLEAEERARQARIEAAARARLRAQELAAQQAVQQASAQAAAVAVESSSDEGSSEPLPPAKYTGVVGIAMQYLGVPYVWGGMSPAGFDCSGFIAYVFAQVGISLPHHAASQFSYGVPVSRDQLQPGDLVFFDGLGHAGIYVGGGQFIHAPHTGDVVKISSLYDSWYDSRWVGGRRLL